MNQSISPVRSASKVLKMLATNFQLNFWSRSKRFFEKFRKMCFKNFCCQVLMKNDANRKYMIYMIFPAFAKL